MLVISFSSFQARSANTDLLGLAPAFQQAQARVDPLLCLGLTLEQGDKCPLSSERPPDFKIPLQDTVQAVLALLHLHRGISIGFDLTFYGDPDLH